VWRAILPRIGTVTFKQIAGNALGVVLLVSGIAELKTNLFGLVGDVPAALPWAVMVFGVAIIAGANWSFVRGFGRSFVPQWDINPVFRDLWPLRRTIRLEDAAREARDATVHRFAGRPAFFKSDSAPPPSRFPPPALRARAIQTAEPPAAAPYESGGPHMDVGVDLSTGQLSGVKRPRRGHVHLVGF
jgi:hypothetical protein